MACRALRKRFGGHGGPALVCHVRRCRLAADQQAKTRRSTSDENGTVCWLSVDAGLREKRGREKAPPHVDFLFKLPHVSCSPEMANMLLQKLFILYRFSMEKTSKRSFSPDRSPINIGDHPQGFSIAPVPLDSAKIW